MSIPIKPIDDLWYKIIRCKSDILKIVTLVVVLAIACKFAPFNYNEKKITDTEQTQIAMSESSEKEEISKAPEITTEVVTTEPQIQEEVAETKSTDTNSTENEPTGSVDQYEKNTNITLDSIPTYSGSAYVVINNNVPYFTDDEMSTTAFEYYTDLDSLGRCGVAYANVCTEIMPTEERGSIGSVKPSGWHTVKYDIVSGKYLYNRCHLIGYQLSAENANTKNLITGTRYLNTEGMLPFENMVADYVKETNNHVLYRVTPMFEGNNLVASGVLIEAKSVEDNGAGILFNVYCYNVQPGISIDYATGDSSLDGSDTTQVQEQQTDTNNNANDGGSDISAVNTTDNSDTNGSVIVHITNSGSKYHTAGCRYLKSDIEVTLDEAKAQGLTPCGVCNPPQ